MRKILASALVCLIAVSAGSQSLTLELCYQMARDNYPLIKQRDLINASRDFTIANAKSGFLPQLSINGQATYQSDVTKVPIDLPNLTIKPLAKDQYKIYGELTQTIYDGGQIKHTAGTQDVSAQVEAQRTEVELYKLRERVNQVYFGILLLDQQLIQNELLKADINTSLTKAKSNLEFGTAIRMNVQILEAEGLKVKQRDIEFKAMRRAYLDMLGILIHRELPDAQGLVTPVLADPSVAELKRPELQLFHLQRELTNQQYALQYTKNMPRLGLFVQGGYGRPGLNALKNEFSTYYIGGLRLSWNLSGFYNSKRDKQLTEINTQAVDVQQELFNFNSNLILRQQSAEVSKLKDLLAVDEDLIALRSQIKETAQVQLNNGVMSANDFLRELNAEDQARQNKILHEVQRLLAIVNYQTTMGN